MENLELQDIRRFSFTELKHITNGFSKECVIGDGGSGVVYKGLLDHGEVIAVKKLHYNQYNSSGENLVNGQTQFYNEIRNLIGVKHTNIIQLVGYCYEAHHILTEYEGNHVFASVEERVLCLEYLEGGSLKDHLSVESCGLEWHVRYGIIKGICEGLKDLHTGYKNPIYHMDLKPENIFLDGNMIPKIGDFGISRLPADSMKTYVTEILSGTLGYMPPEYIKHKEISPKSDVYSLGVILIQVISGEEGYKSYDNTRPSKEFIERVHKNWGKRQQASMSSHSLDQVVTCTKIALRCVKFDRKDRPTITDIVDELNKIDDAQSSTIGGQNMEEDKNATLEKQLDIQKQKKSSMGHLDEKMKQVDGRTKNNLPALVPMDLPKAVGVMSANLSPPSRRIGSQEPIYLQDDILHLQSDMQRLRDTLPRMYNLINGAEWRSHEHCVAELLPKLKDAVYDADDLLDEFRWYEMKVELEGNASKYHFTDFFATVIQGNSNKLNDIQGRLDHLSSQLEKMGLHGVALRFDKSVRPETSSLPNETKIFGRDNDLKLVIGSLGVPTNSKRKRAKSSVIASTRTSLGNTVSNESRIQSLSVLPIVGIGGVGKTTLAQHICSHKEVKSHFKLRIWICVSDDFDVKRLTKEVIQSCTGKKATVDNLDSLQHALFNHVKNKRILIVLDDMWDDALKENGDCWKRFCAPLQSAQEGSMMLVTTRCPKVVEGVRTMKPVILEGLKDNDFWEFFRLCAFGSESSNNDPELERIGRCILPKLKGSPLAAKTLGRILRMNLQESRWNCILESELWKLPQEATEILPALRLSYMYLPFHLKRCFSFCAVYPKDYKFRKEDLAEIWVAEGFVEPQGDHPIQDIGCQYFEDLVARSFFQKVNGGYVIHDLLHDMAQKVSEHDCFILRQKNDFDKVPLNVRHIFIHPSSDFDNSNLLSLCKHKKLRTLICQKQSVNKKSAIMDKWCSKLLGIRVLSCASTNELPDSIGNLKHLRYLKISKGRPLSIPPTFSSLYNLQILYVKTCTIERLPDDFSNLRHLQRFVSEGFSYNSMSVNRIDAARLVQGLSMVKNLNQFRGDLEITNVDMLSKCHAAEGELKKKKCLYKLTLKWSSISESQTVQHDAVEVLQVMQPPMSLRSLLLEKYPGVSLPRWSQPHMINLNDSIGIFASLTDLDISGCQNLSSLEHFLHPDYVPTIKKIQLQNCISLVSVPTERFGDLYFLEDLEVRGCPNIRSLSLVSPSLKQLKLGDCGNLLDNIDCPSLKSFHIVAASVTCIQTQMWRLPALQDLRFWHSMSLTSIGVSTSHSLAEGTYIIRAFSSFPSLKHLSIIACPHLNWQRGLVLPSSLKKLELHYCGDFSACVPGCLENLTSLVSLKIAECHQLTSIPGNIWRSKLALLEELIILYCPNLVSIGGAEAVAQIKKVEITRCPNLKEVGLIMRRC